MLRLRRFLKHARPALKVARRVHKHVRPGLDCFTQIVRLAWKWLGPGMPPPATSARPVSTGGPLAQLAVGYPLPTWQPLARTIVVIIALSVIWACFAEMDEFAIANGDIVPEGKVKVIQHLEGGIVRDISVSEGSEVREGTPLMQLELAITSLNRDELQVRIDGLTLQRARLEAEINGTPLHFPEAESLRQPQLVEAERRSFEARRQALNATIAVLRDQREQKHSEIQELETKQRALAANLRLARERFDMSKELMKSGLTARMDHVQLQAQMEDLDGQLSMVRASLPRVESALTESEQKIVEEQAKSARTAQGELATAELDIARNHQLMNQATDQQIRTQILSPIDGIVKNLRANTIGGVIRAGDPIMEIVPINDRLQVDARLSPADRGYVRVGQKATVKLSAYDYTTYGGLDGIVTLVAPDTTVSSAAQSQSQSDPQQQAFYRVVVQTDRAWLGDETQKHMITAGMQATVEIHTGSRTMMYYLIKPALKLRHEAFRER